MTMAGRKFVSVFLEGVLRDQLGKEPAPGQIYIYTMFWPGAIYENCVNGGKQ